MDDGQLFYEIFRDEVSRLHYQPQGRESIPWEDYKIEHSEWVAAWAKAERKFVSRLSALIRARP